MAPAGIGTAGTGRVLKDTTAGGKTWMYVLELGVNGAGRRSQRRRRGFASKRDAQQALQADTAQLLRGELTGPGRRTVAEFAAQWLDTVSMTLTPSGFGNYRKILQIYVLPRLGTTQLADLRPLTLSSLYATLLRSGGRNGRALSPTTVRLVHKCVHKMCADAVTWGVLAVNPATRATVPRRVRAELSVWTPEQAATFLRASADSPLAACWQLALVTGLRRGELAGLAWAQVDLTAGTLAVTGQRTTDTDGRVLSAPPKAGSRRRLDLAEQSVASLRRLRARQTAERLAAGAAYVGTGLVFTHPDGRAYHPQHITDLFHAEAEQAGLPKIRLHDLRHTAATLALMAGVHPKVVQERLGHTTIGMTLDTYSHVLTGMGRDAADKVEALLQTSGATVPPRDVDTG